MPSILILALFGICSNFPLVLADNETCYIPQLVDRCQHTQNVCQSDYMYNGSRSSALKTVFENQEKFFYFLIDNQMRCDTNDTFNIQVKEFFNALSAFLVNVNCRYSSIKCYEFNNVGNISPLWNDSSQTTIKKNSFDGCTQSLNIINQPSDSDDKLRKVITNFENYLPEYVDSSKSVLWVLTDAQRTVDSNLDNFKSLYLRDMTVFTASVGKCPKGYFNKLIYEEAMHKLSSGRREYSACIERWIHDFDDLPNAKDCDDLTLPSNNPPTGLLVGAILGSILGFTFLCLIIALFCYCWYLKRNNKIYGLQFVSSCCKCAWCFKPTPSILILALFGICSNFPLVLADNDNETCYIPQLVNQCQHTQNVCQSDYMYNGSRSSALKTVFEKQEKIFYFLIDNQMHYDTNDTLNDQVKEFFKALSAFLVNVSCRYSSIKCYEFDNGGNIFPLWNDSSQTAIKKNSFDGCTQSLNIINQPSDSDDKLRKVITNFENYLPKYVDSSKSVLWVLTDAERTVNSNLENFKSFFLRDMTVFTASVAKCPKGYFNNLIYEEAMHKLSSGPGYSACIERWIHDLGDLLKNVNAKDCDNPQTGLLVGAILGSILGFTVLCLIIALFCYCWHLKRNNKIYGLRFLSFYCSCVWCCRPPPPVPRFPHPPPKDHQSSGNHEYTNKNTLDGKQGGSVRGGHLVACNRGTIIGSDDDTFLTVLDGTLAAGSEIRLPVFYTSGVQSNDAPVRSGSTISSMYQPPHLHRPTPAKKSKPVILDKLLNGWGEYLEEQVGELNVDFLACHHMDSSHKAFAKSSHKFTLSKSEEENLIKLFQTSSKENSKFEMKKTQKGKFAPKPPTITSLSSTFPKPNVHIGGEKFRINEINPEFISANAFLENRKRSNDGNEYTDEYTFYAMSDGKWIVLSIFKATTAPSFLKSVKTFLEKTLNDLNKPAV